MPQQLYAKIKKSSKYSYQNEWAKEKGPFPFPVTIAGRPCDFCVHGNSNQYRLQDVNLFIVVDGVESKIG